MKNMIFCVFLVCSLVLIGCTRPQQVGDVTSVAPTTINPVGPNIAQPEAGKAILKGRVLNLQNQPWANTGARLAEVVRNAEDPNNAAFVLSESSSPDALTNADGYFVFNNIVPGEYVLIIGDVYGKYKAILGDDLVTRVFTPTADQILDVGDIKVDLEAP